MGIITAFEGAVKRNKALLQYLKGFSNVFLDSLGEPFLTLKIPRAPKSFCEKKFQLPSIQVTPVVQKMNFDTSLTISESWPISDVNDPL